MGIIKKIQENPIKSLVIFSAVRLGIEELVTRAVLPFLFHVQVPSGFHSLKEGLLTMGPPVASVVIGGLFSAAILSLFSKGKELDDAPLVMEDPMVLEEETGDLRNENPAGAPSALLTVGEKQELQDNFS